MKILAIGHSFVVDSNRKFWNDLASFNSSAVDIVVPNRWYSELVGDVPYRFNPKTDQNFQNIFPLECFLSGKPSSFLFNPFKLHGLLNSQKYDAIYLWQETWSLSALEIVLLKALSKNSQTKIYLHICQNLKKPKLRFLIPLEKFISKKMTALFCCCGEIEEVIRWKGIDTDCKYFPFPYDESVYQKNLENKQENQLLKLGYFGRLDEEKGLDNLLATCDQLNKEGKEFTLKVGGSGPYEKKFTERSYVEFVGVIPHIEAPQFYNDVDIFVLPSESRSFWKEQFGRVLVEAVSSGCLVVGSDSGAIPEVLGLMEMPFVFKEGDSASLKEQISKAMDSYHSNKEEILENSLKKAFDYFSFESNSGRFKNIVTGPHQYSSIEFKDGKVNFL